MYMVVKLVYSTENRKDIARIKPIYTNIPNTE